MEKITLNPGEWTPFQHSRFQVIGQSSVRIGVGSGNSNSGTYAPPAASAPYFTTQGYDPKVIDPLALLGFDTPSAYLYLMPDGAHAVEIVAL